MLGGMDMTMPGDGHNWDDRLSLFGPNLTVAMLNSSIPIERLDDMTTRIGIYLRPQRLYLPRRRRQRAHRSP